VIWPLNRLKHSLLFRRGHLWTDVRQTSLLACRPTRSVIEVPMTGSPRKLCLHQSRRARDYLESPQAE
jgi:hypothetical protein